MDNFGYFNISRKMKHNFLYPSNENRKFTKYEAWIFLIEKAFFFCIEKCIDNKKIVIPRGYFDTTIEQLSDELKWDRRTTEKFLKMLEKENQIRRFKISNSRKSCTLLKVSNYNAFQLPNADKCKLKCKLKCKTYCKTQCKLECTPNKELKERKGNKINNNYINSIEQFNYWYNLYPKKEGNKKAEASFLKVIKEVSYETLVNGLKKYIEHIERNKIERQFIKQPATWLNQGCWDDEYTEQKTEVIQAPQTQEELDLLWRQY